MAAGREDTSITAYSHKGGEEANRPQCHKCNPSDDGRAILGNAKHLQVEERHRGLDETHGKDASHDKRVVVLSNL